MNAETGLPFPQRYWAILCVALGITLAVLDGAIANVALPTIAHDLRTSDAGSIWIVNAYQLAITISLLPLAALGDRSATGASTSRASRCSPPPRSAARCPARWRRSRRCA